MADLILSWVLLGLVLGGGFGLLLELLSLWRAADLVAVFTVEGPLLAEVEARRAAVVFGVVPLMAPPPLPFIQRAPDGVQ